MTAWAEAVGLKASEKVAQIGKVRIGDVTAADPMNHVVRAMIQPKGSRPAGSRIPGWR